MSTFDIFHLKTNPFRLTPSTDANELVWAGFPEIKRKIEQRIRRSIQIPNTSLILNWGEYGSGKTHAAKYFSKENVLKELAGEDHASPYSITICFPKSKDPVKDIFIQIVDRINFTELRTKLMNSEIDLPVAIQFVTDNLFIRNLFSTIFNKQEQPIEEFLVKGYLYGTSDAKELLKKGVLRKLSTDTDYTEFLGALFSLMTYENKAYSCVILWIDEFEDISILNSTNISNVNNFIRTIIDKTPNNLLIFLNLTQSSMMDVQDLGEYLQEAVRSRIKDRIELKMPDSDELKLYIKELLNHPAFRDDSMKDYGYEPFSEEVIDAIIADLGIVSLRRYNEAFSLLLENAAFDNKAVIDMDYYNGMKDEIIGWK